MLRAGKGIGERQHIADEKSAPLVRRFFLCSCEGLVTDAQLVLHAEDAKCRSRDAFCFGPFYLGADCSRQGYMSALH